MIPAFLLLPRMIKEKSSSPPNSDDKYLGSKKITQSEISVTPPALKLSPKKKFGMFGKLSKKVEEEIEVKPKFQFHQSKDEQKTIKDHFSFGKDKRIDVDKASDSKKVEDKSQSKKSKVFEEDVDPDLKDLFGGKADKGSVSKKSKNNGSLKKKSGKSKIFEEDLDTEEDNSTKKLEKRMKADKKENKKSIGKVAKKPIEQESPVKKPSFKFLEEDKVSAQNSKSKKAPSKSKVKEEEIEPVVKTKESISSVFEVEDDPYVLEIQARKKKEAEKLAARTKVKTKGRKRESMARMAEFSQSLTGSQSLDECSQESSSDESAPKFKIPKLKKPRKKKESDPSQKKINSFFKQDVTSKEKESNDEMEEARDYTPSIDELLKLPERPEDGGKTMDEVLDDLDIEIAERKKKHEEEMAKIDTDIAAEKQRQEERRERMKRNAVLRDRLELEITESVLRKMFEENIEYLRDIEAGRVESSRHQAFHKSSRTRHALYYTMITDPFTDDQLEWTLEEMGKVWMKTKRAQMDNNEYVWKVLLAECFIKFYMDHFGFDKKETEKRISETPLRKAAEDSEEDNSSDEDM